MYVRRQRERVKMLLARKKSQRVLQTAQLIKESPFWRASEVLQFYTGREVRPAQRMKIMLANFGPQNASHFAAVLLFKFNCGRKSQKPTILRLWRPGVMRMKGWTLTR